MLELGIWNCATSMKVLRCWILGFAGALIALADVRGGDIYTFDQTGSTISFQVHHLLGIAKGEFHRFSGTIDLNRDDPERSNVSARIDVASIDSGIPKRDNHLRSADFFDVAKYPEITFQSRSVKRTSERAGDVSGEFRMHGVKRPIVLHVQLIESRSNDRTRWKVTTAPLKRRDFGLLFGGTAEAVSGIGQDVSVNIEVESRRAR
jgi:polyisoprenoid-binding protein YceI